MIAAVNGPALIHAELALLCDIVLVSQTAVFQGLPHFPSGLGPREGVHVVFPLLLGANRGRYFLLDE
jgi:enoyl-CoA hydratase/carnithine racemase